MHRYTVRNDSAGWMIVDPHTGDITVAKTPDRESSHVVNGVYTIVLNAVDNGKTLGVAAGMDTGLGSIKHLNLITTVL